jgi:hypothetical protein
MKVGAYSALGVVRQRIVKTTPPGGVPLTPSTGRPAIALRKRLAAAGRLAAIGVSHWVASVRA